MALFLGNQKVSAKSVCSVNTSNATVNVTITHHTYDIGSYNMTLYYGDQEVSMNNSDASIEISVLPNTPLTFIVSDYYSSEESATPYFEMANGFASIEEIFDTVNKRGVMVLRCICQPELGEDYAQIDLAIY